MRENEMFKTNIVRCIVYCYAALLYIYSNNVIITIGFITTARAAVCGNNCNLLILTFKHATMIIVCVCVCACKTIKFYDTFETKEKQIL